VLARSVVRRHRYGDFHKPNSSTFPTRHHPQALRNEVVKVAEYGWSQTCVRSKKGDLAFASQRGIDILADRQRNRATIMPVWGRRPNFGFA
jgi:hypothetical protein